MTGAAEVAVIPKPDVVGAEVVVEVKLKSGGAVAAADAAGAIVV